VSEVLKQVQDIIRLRKSEIYCLSKRL